MGSSSRLRQNPVGAEYILMERVKGRQLSDVWDTMSEAQRFGLAKNLVEIERRLASTTFAGYGGLYHKDAIPSSNSMTALVETDQGATPEFVLGPTTERSFWEDEKRELEIDRGPCMTTRPLFFFLGRKLKILFTQGKPRRNTSRLSQTMRLRRFKN